MEQGQLTKLTSSVWTRSITVDVASDPRVRLPPPTRVFVLRSDTVAAHLCFPGSGKNIFSTDQVLWMLRVVRGRHCELLLLALFAAANLATFCFWADPFEDKFGPLTKVSIFLFWLAGLLPTAFMVLTLQMTILKRTLFRFECCFHLANVIFAGVWHSICYKGSWLVKAAYIISWTLYPGFIMGSCHALQLRQWMPVLFLVQGSLCPLFCVLAAAALPATFEDVHTRLGDLPFQMSGLTQLMTSNVPSSHCSRSRRPCIYVAGGGMRPKGCEA
jgi:hypothetical protein